MAGNQDLVTVATFDTLAEAEIARGLLQAEGIEVVLQDQPLASLLPPVAFANGGLALKVAPDELERARECLETPDDADVDGDPDAEALGAPEASGDGAGI
jgi:hypothetical protein